MRALYSSQATTAATSVVTAGESGAASSVLPDLYHTL